MPFKGFNVVYPEYEVITPQTKQSFTLKTLNVQEEERLKGSMVSPAKITEHLNKSIYENIIKKPVEITDYKTFLKSTTIKDREALLFGLYHITYGEIRNYELGCTNPRCAKEFSVTVQAINTFGMTPYDGTEDIIQKRVSIDLPMTTGVSVTIRQPTLYHEDDALKNYSSYPGFSMELINETLLVEKFEQIDPLGKDVAVYTDRIDIIDAYKSLAAKDKRFIYEQYKENFGKYQIELKLKAFCSHCGNEQISNIDLMENFFRMVYSS